MSPGIANSRNIRAGAAYIELTTQDSKLVRGLDKAQKRVKAFGKSVGEIGKRLTAVSAVAANFFDLDMLERIKVLGRGPCANPYASR